MDKAKNQLEQLLILSLLQKQAEFEEAKVELNDFVYLLYLYEISKIKTPKEPVNFVDPFGLRLGKTGGTGIAGAAKDKGTSAPSKNNNGNTGKGKSTEGREGRQPGGVTRNYDKVTNKSEADRITGAGYGATSTDLGNGQYGVDYNGFQGTPEGEANREKAVGESISLGSGQSSSTGEAGSISNENGSIASQGNSSSNGFSNGISKAIREIGKGAKDWWDEVGNWDYVSGQIDYWLNCPMLGEVNLGFLAGTKAVMLLGRFGDDAVRLIGKTSLFTKSNLKLGQKMHKAYKLDNVNKSLGKIKEFVIPNSGGKRIDFIDFGTKTIYELKPNNPRAIKQGMGQLNTYKELVEKEFGPGWKTFLDTY